MRLPTKGGSVLGYFLCFALTSVVASGAEPDRAWKSRAGSTIHATLVDTTPEQVLLRAAGRTVRIPIFDLSDEDRLYVWDWIKRASIKRPTNVFESPRVRLTFPKTNNDGGSIGFVGNSSTVGYVILGTKDTFVFGDLVMPYHWNTTDIHVKCMETSDFGEKRTYSKNKAIPGIEKSALETIRNQIRTVRSTLRLLLEPGAAIDASENRVKEVRSITSFLKNSDHLRMLDPEAEPSKDIYAFNPFTLKKGKSGSGPFGIKHEDFVTREPMMGAVNAQGESPFWRPDFTPEAPPYAFIARLQKIEDLLHDRSIPEAIQYGNALDYYEEIAVQFEAFTSVNSLWRFPLDKVGLFGDEVYAWLDYEVQILSGEEVVYSKKYSDR